MINDKEQHDSRLAMIICDGDVEQYARLQQVPVKDFLIKLEDYVMRHKKK